MDEGIRRTLEDISPIEDYSGSYAVEFGEHRFEEPPVSIEECMSKDKTYAAPLFVRVRFVIKETGEVREQDVFMGDFPLMTDWGTFIINGTERVVVTQLVRSPGAYVMEPKDPTKQVLTASLMPHRGSWLEFEVETKGYVSVRIDRKRKLPVTVLLKALGFGGPEEILERFGRSWLIRNTLERDDTTSREDALLEVFRRQRPGEPVNLENAQNLVDGLFFDPKRYDLSEVGRYKVNKRLKLDVPRDVHTLTLEDIEGLLKRLLGIAEEVAEEEEFGRINYERIRHKLDEYEHFGNRRLRTVGELVQEAFRIGMYRMERVVRERMTTQDEESITPQTVVNTKPVASAIKEFFGSSQLSQFMDQTNTLAGLSHRRRLNAMGAGGLSRERAPIEVRDVHPTHYGRMCPIETPEGPNIGLIGQLSTFARVNEYGFVQTPYRKVEDGRVTDEIEYLSADEEEEYTIAQANTPVDLETGRITAETVLARSRGGDVTTVSPEEVDYMDVSPVQTVSVATSLIPFLEHDDANRALMGANMQRQAVPLLQPEAPIVGTGMEARVARDSRALLVAEGPGVVEYVDAERIVIRYDQDPEDAEVSFEEPVKEYRLIKFRRTNQDTCINMRPIVKVGQRVEKGTVLCDGFATEKGELALGKNVLVAFMPWRGYNFEDAIVISERLVAEDVFTSVHIEEFECQVRDTKRGQEELTREIPNVSEEATKDLDERGIIRVGAEVKAGDILVGKVTPKGETEPTPEEKLLRAIFGDKAGDVKDASLKAPPGMKGVVIDTKLFSRRKLDPASKKREQQRLAEIDEQLQRDLAELDRRFWEKFFNLVEGQVSAGVETREGDIVLPEGMPFTREAFEKISPLRLNPMLPFTQDETVNRKVQKLLRNYEQVHRRITGEAKRLKHQIQMGDELPPGIVQLAKVYIARKRKIQVGDKMAGRHGNKGVVAKIVPVEDMPFLEDGTPVDIVLNPLGVPSRMNLGQIYETLLGWAGKVLGRKFASPVFDGATLDDIKALLREAGLPEDGRVQLYDGRTGEPLDEKTTVGYIYMMKLNHLVEDKIHARSIGPYSLITQQPLGGKAQFGGQRLGEMEVWALYAYGAAHTLQEMLTYKSDDVQGRSKAYEAIVKGENLPEPGIPESFNVLVRELQGLGLEVRLD